VRQLPTRVGGLTRARQLVRPLDPIRSRRRAKLAAAAAAHTRAEGRHRYVIRPGVNIDLGMVTAGPAGHIKPVDAVAAHVAIRGSRSALWRFFERHNITSKKSLQAAERWRADVARAGRLWIREQGDPAHLVLSTTRQSVPTWCGSTAADHVARG